MPTVSTLVDRVKIFAASSGTGPFVLGPVVSGFRGAEALVDGNSYSYAVEQGGDYEVGTAQYVLSSNTLVRSPTLSSRGNALVPFTSGAQIAFTALAKDFMFGDAAALRLELASDDGASVIGTASGDSVQEVLAGTQPKLTAGTNIVINNTDPENPVISSVGVAGAAAWGSITGSIASQSDLSTALGGKAAVGSIGSSGLTLAAGKLAGRYSGTTGAIQNITIGAGLALDGSGTLTSTAGAVAVIPFTSINTITVTGDFWWSSGYTTKGIGAALYVADATANLALATAHPLFCKADASGKYFRLVIPADGLIPIACAGVVGWATENNTVNHQPGIAAANAYNTALTGIAGVRFGPNLHYSCWVPNRTVNNTNWQGTGDKSGIPFNATKALDWDLNGSTLHRRAANGGDPNVASNFQVIGGKLWRGGTFISQPRMAAAPANREDRYFLRIRNGSILGGIPRGTNFSPVDPTVAAPDGWDINDKCLAADPDQFSGDWDIRDLRIDGFRGETLYSANDVTSICRLRTVWVANTNAQPINGNGCIVDVDGFIGELGGFCMELWGGRNGRIVNALFRNCDAGGVLQGGRTAPSGPYNTPTRVVSTEIPWFEVDIAIQNGGAGVKALALGSFLDGKISFFDSDFIIGNQAAFPSVAHINLQILMALDQVNDLTPSLYGSATGGTKTTDNIHLDMTYQRTAVAVAASRRFGKPLSWGGSMGENIRIQTTLRGQDFTQVAQSVSTVTDYSPKFFGDIFEQQGNWYSYGGASIDVNASGSITKIAPCYNLYNGPNTTNTYYFELPTSGVVDGQRCILRNGDNGTYFSSGDFASGRIRNAGLVLRPKEWAILEFDGGFWSIVRAPAPFVTTVSALPTPNAGFKGARGTVTDATATTFLSTVAGGGANNVPVVCDGTNWKIG